MPDHLQIWCDVRAEVPWQQTRLPDQPGRGSIVAVRDGAVHDIKTVERVRDPARATRMLSALSIARTDAGAAAPLTFTLLRGWQRVVLGTPHVSFRSGPAFAKAGAEIDPLGPDTAQLFDSHLAQSVDPDLPLSARAARAYLDVCFFHPFVDGNARSAFLTLVFVLAKAGVVLDQVGPIRRVQRFADDPDAALALANLVTTLIDAAARRRTHLTAH